MTETFWAGIIAAVVGGIVTITSKWWPLHRPRKSESSRLDELRGQIIREIRDELRDCRRRSDELEQLVRTERWRTALLIRALQEAAIPVPRSAMLDVHYDPATDSYTLHDQA